MREHDAGAGENLLREQLRSTRYQVSLPTFVSRLARVFEPLHLTPDLRAPTGRQSTFSFVFLCLSVCVP